MDSYKFFRYFEGNDLADEHHIAGLLYNRFGHKRYLSAWKKQALRNTLLLEELDEFSKSYPKVCESLVLLKGCALLNDVYTDIGERFMSDVDILCLDGKGEVEKILEARGYRRIESSSWLGNDFKSEWTKLIHGMEINIELHEKLFYHREDQGLGFSDSKVSGFKQLDIESNYIHLLGHAGFQHNFQKLYWIFDLYYFLEKYESQMDQEKVRKLISHYTLKNSESYMRKIFSILFKGDDVGNMVVSEKTILNPNQAGIRSYLLKHILKGTVFEAIKYDFSWGANQILRWLKVR